MQSPLILATAVDEDVEPSTLNPNAPSFVPSYQSMGEEEGRRVDDIMSTVHHFASVNDTETLNAAAQWLGHDPHHWVANGLEYTYGDGMVDHSLGFYCDKEDMMRDGLYRAPQRAKGNTYGRSRNQSRWPRQ